MVHYYKTEEGWLAVLLDDNGQIMKKSKLCRDRKEAQKEAKRLK